MTKKHSGRIDDEPQTTRQPSDPLRHIMLAVVHRAFMDARDGDDDARHWLLIEGVQWLSACGIDTNEHSLYNRLKE